MAEIKIEKEKVRWPWIIAFLRPALDQKKVLNAFLQNAVNLIQKMTDNNIKLYSINELLNCIDTMRAIKRKS